MIRLLHIALAVDEGAPDLSWLGPTVTAVGAVMVATVGAISLVWRRRQDKRADIEAAAIAHEPDVTDGWAEVRLARAEATKYYNLYRLFEDLYWTVSSALRHLARHVHDAHPDHQFDKDVVEALAVKPPNVDDPK